MAAEDFIVPMATKPLTYLLVGTQRQILFRRPGLDEMRTRWTLALVQPERLPSSDCLLGSDLPSNVQTHIYQTGFYVKTNVSGMFKGPLRRSFNTDQRRSVRIKSVKTIEGFTLFRRFGPEKKLTVRKEEIFRFYVWKFIFKALWIFFVPINVKNGLIFLLNKKNFF